MGIDIRNMGTDDSDDGAVDPNGNNPWYAPGGGTWQGTISNGSGQTSGQTGGATPAPVPGSANWNQLLQNIHNAINSNGMAPVLGFTGTAKLNDMFAVDFLGFNFGAVNAHGTPNIDIMEDATLAIGNMKRSKSGWAPFDLALMDDEESDVIRIVHRQMDEQAAHGDMFDMTVRYYDKQGNETSTMYLVDCEFIEVTTEPLNMATQVPNTPLKMFVTVQPKLVRYS